MRWGILLIVLVVPGCYDVSVSEIPPALTIDGTSEETFTASVDAIRAGLTVEERKQFETGMHVISAGAVTPSSLVPGSVQRSVLDTLHGKTAAEVIEVGAARERLVAKRTSGQDTDEVTAFSAMTVILRRDKLAAIQALYADNIDSEYTAKGIRIWGDVKDDEGTAHTFEAELPKGSDNFAFAYWINLDGKRIYSDDSAGDKRDSKRPAGLPKLENDEIPSLEPMDGD